MAFEIRGVIESISGKPWSWPERERMLGFLAAQGYNLYVYVPGGDPMQGERWQEPYLPEELRRFAALARLCDDRGVELAMGLGPAPADGAGPAPAEVVDPALLWERAADCLSAGVRSFLLRVGAGGAPLANAQQEWLSAHGGRRLLVRAEALPDLGEALAPEIDILWPAPTAAITVAAARAACTALRRRVLIWDNYPVNDGNMCFDMHVRPASGREPGLSTVVRGSCAAAALQPELGKIALQAYAEFMQDPEHFDWQLAYERALTAITGDVEDASAVGTVANLARRSDLESALDNSWFQKLHAFWQRWGGPPPAAGPELPGAPPPSGETTALRPPPGETKALRQPPGETAALRPSLLERQAAVAVLARDLTRLRWKAERVLHGLKNPLLSEEAHPWASKLLGWLEATEVAVEVLRVALVDGHDARLSVLREKTLTRLAAARESPYWVAGDMFDQFARRCLWAAAALDEE